MTSLTFSYRSRRRISLCTSLRPFFAQPGGTVSYFASRPSSPHPAGCEPSQRDIKEAFRRAVAVEFVQTHSVPFQTRRFGVAISKIYYRKVTDGGAFLPSVGGCGLSADARLEVAMSRIWDAIKDVERRLGVHSSHEGEQPKPAIPFDRRCGERLRVCVPIFVYGHSIKGSVPISRRCRE
jgi:hypothetical protein